jgi:hypothetical protein
MGNYSIDRASALFVSERGTWNLGTVVFGTECKIQDATPITSISARLPPYGCGVMVIMVIWFSLGP